MKVGDLVRYKHYFDETGIVIKVHAQSFPQIDVLMDTGEIAVHLDPDAFEVINENPSR